MTEVASSVRVTRRGGRGRARRGAGRARDGARRGPARCGSPTSSPRSTTARSTGDDADALAELLELGLQTGRIRALYGPEGEQAALALFRRLPLGRELTESTRELNEALQALEGRTIERVAVTALDPASMG